MSHANNKMEWCLKKAEKEMKEKGKHRGLLKLKPDLKLARAHIAKAEHLLKGTDYLKKGNFSDISATTVFYSMYHCLLAICTKFGYDSRNQECTFALIYSFIETNKIDFDKDLLDKIAALEVKEQIEETSIEIRENYQYGTKISMELDLYNKMFKLAQDVITTAKRVIEK